jgi:hypothetical protein
MYPQYNNNMIIKIQKRNNTGDFPYLTEIMITQIQEAQQKGKLDYESILSIKTGNQKITQNR